MADLQYIDWNQAGKYRRNTEDTSAPQKKEEDVNKPAYIFLMLV
jgi:hypothetical protein